MNFLFQNKASSSRPFGPFTDIDRYSDKYHDRYTDNNRDLDEAYKKGLASAIYELYQRPSRYQENHNGYRDYYQYDRELFAPGNVYKPHRGAKYGLYDSSGDFYYGRSANTTITAADQKS